MDRLSLAALPGLVLQAAIRIYQLVLSPVLQPSCRFHPSCSEYARQAIARFGALDGTWLAVKRLARCHPWGGSGHDPVPESLADTHPLGHRHG
jgi:putative membrane protein insertion efficiency factor